MPTAPFSKEKVDELNKQQNSGRFHPYTCPNDGDKAHKLFEFKKLGEEKSYDEYIAGMKESGIPFPEALFTETNLIATEQGWICPVCSYTQAWSH